jgi:hypothetical protein
LRIVGSAQEADGGKARNPFVDPRSSLKYETIDSNPLDRQPVSSMPLPRPPASAALRSRQVLRGQIGAQSRAAAAFPGGGIRFAVHHDNRSGGD